MRPRLRRALVPLTACLAVLAVAAGVGWWVTHPDPEPVSGYGVGIDVAVGETVWTVLIHRGQPPEGPVTLTSLSPVVARDDARVRIEYRVCDLDPATLERTGTGSFGTGRGQELVDEFCTSLRPAEGAVVDPDDLSEVIVGITPTRAGRSRVVAHEAEYRAGWRDLQRGHTELDVEVVLDARPAT